MKKIIVWVIGSVSLLMCCVETTPYVLPFDEPLLVVEGVLSDQPGFTSIKLGWSYQTGTTCGYPFDEDSYNSEKCIADTISPPMVTGQLVLREEGGFEFSYSIKVREPRGYFHIPSVDKLVGKPGGHYTLDIELTFQGNKLSYHAETTMLTTPEIQSIDFEIRSGPTGKGDYFVPLISFNEPRSERNYYLFKLCPGNNGPDPSKCTGSSRVWNVSVLSDTFLPEEVKNLAVDNGVTVAKYNEFYPDAYPGATAEVQMFSVDRTTYLFYKSLLEQFSNDGGGYSPSPATPVGNIKGSAIGIFCALNNSFGKVTIPE